MFIRVRAARVAGGWMTQKIYISTATVDGNVKARYAWSLFTSALALVKNGWDLHFLHPDLPLNDNVATFDLMRYLNRTDEMPKARSISAHQFLKYTDGTHLLMIDSDVVWTPKTLAGVVKEGQTKDLVGATYPRKDINWNEVAQAVRDGHDPRWGMGRYVYLADKPITQDDVDGQSVPVQALGMGFTLLSRSCLMTMTDYMRQMHTYFDDSLGEDIVCIFDNWKNSTTKQRKQEDYAFCHRWREELGQKVWMYVGAGAPCSHEGSFLFDGTAGGMMHH